MIDSTRYATADAPQLSLPKTELDRLAMRVDEDYRNALSDHDARMKRFQNYYMRWRGRTELPELGSEDDSNFRVPITQWQVYSKLAKEMASLFGEDAEVVAKPIGPNDQRLVTKVSRFISWRVFESMKVINPATTFVFRKILFGRAHAYAPWHRDVYQIPLKAGGEQEVVSYEGPGFFPLWPDDFVCPAEDVETLHDFSFCMRRFRVTPNDLLRGEAAGRYQNIRGNYAELVNFVGAKRQRDLEGDIIKREKDLAEGVTYEGNMSSANSMQVHEWYGRWRRLTSRKDASLTNLKGRELYESELVIRFIPELHKIVSIQDLAAMYPRMKNRRPFVESALVRDGSYWGPSFGELLEDIEKELSVNHNLATQAGQFTAGPIIVYRPAAGFDPDMFEYKPMSTIATDDPSSVKVLELKADLSFVQIKEQAMISYSERVTGISDQNLGRASDRPNAPRTARQSLALLEEGDVRAGLDMSVLREDWGEIIHHFWQLEQMYGSERVFFRVTEEDSGGLFDVAKGGSFMMADEREEDYDFDLKFATNAWSKEVNKQNQLQLYALDLQNPLVQQNPKALWRVLDKIHKAFGDDRFSDAIPEPPDMGLPVAPAEEWTRMLQGDQDVHPNPQDNDQLHLTDHHKRLVEAAADPESDQEAYKLMVKHIQETMQQMAQKQLMAEITSRLVQKLHDQNGGLTAGGGPPMPLQQLHGQIGQMIGDPNAPQPAAPGAQPGGPQQ